MWFQTLGNKRDVHKRHPYFFSYQQNFYPENFDLEHMTDTPEPEEGESSPYRFSKRKRSPAKDVLFSQEQLKYPAAGLRVSAAAAAWVSDADFGAYSW